ncbi:MAG: hypothetical protein HY574_07600 [candidate division NC10 bacterium]|nr:hypothetical protein [candidate division NC10 bacterium]
MKITRIAHSVKRDSCAPECAMACPLQGLPEQLGIPTLQNEGLRSSAQADQPSKPIGPKRVNLIGAGS